MAGTDRQMAYGWDRQADSLRLGQTDIKIVAGTDRQIAYGWASPGSWVLVLANRGPTAKKIPTNTSCVMSVPCSGGTAHVAGLQGA